ncbi:glycerol kinase [Magnaporthiopsis poae ATCC 64411]|uniref:glycerol kinase n=1 Tax=Magnaporthiopsis poae (strain ATCC 64411 / 73-15) TaxID=644358 RepID=A0A0C4EBT7_MAGP6|nr:glycerol kinase [Magnaporthiopsis poae ATCC 64411]
MSPASVNGTSNLSYIGAIDQGTTSSRFLIFSPSGDVVATHQLEFKQFYPQPGWHEHDPEEIVSSVEKCIDGAVADFETQGHTRDQIKAVGITNQRETTVVWDRTTGKALHNAIVWTDTRSKDLVRRLKRRLGAGELTGRCGLPLSTYPIAVAGSSVKFLVDNFGFIESSAKLSALAETVEDNGGCTFVTAFSGLFAPYWIDDARGTIFGITSYTQRGHVARATLEATCFQTKAILDAMEKDSGAALTELAVDGGMCNSDLIMQTQSDIIGIPVNRPAMRETTALGAAIAAGFAVGVWESFDDLKEVNKAGNTIFKPQIKAEEAAKRFGRWEKAVEMCRGWTS